jgi:small conductance mechanosensitive channel
MRESIFRIIIFIVVITALTFGSKTHAQQSAAEAEREELKDIIKVLEDPEDAKKLAAQLKAILKAKEKEASEEKQDLPKAKIPSNLFKAYRSVKNNLQSILRGATAEIKGLPLTPGEWKAYLSEDENWQEFWSLIIKLFIAFLIGLGAMLGFRRLTRKLEEKIEWKQPLSPPRRVGLALTSTLLRVYPWVCICLFFYFFMNVVSIPPKIESLALYYLLTLLVYFTIKHLTLYLLSPEEREKRTIAISDEAASYFAAWGRRVLLFWLLMAFFIIPSSLFERPTLESAFIGLLRIGVFVFVAIVFLHWNESIGKMLCKAPTLEEPYWKGRARAMCNYMARKIYLVAIFYLGVVIALPVLGFPNIFRSLLYVSAQSVGIVVLAVGLWFLWNLIYQRIFHWSGKLKERHVELREHMDRYTGFLKKAGNLFIFLFTAASLMEIWGLQAYELIRSNAALLQPLVRIPVIALISILLMDVTDLLISRLEGRVSVRMLNRNKMSVGEVAKRVSTLGRIVKKAAVVAIVTVTTMMVLDELGFDIKPILAGAGVLGLAVGFGAQSLVRDIISGLFFIIENRIRVGDVAIINGTGGLVEEVNPRTTILRGQDGTIHVFPNGTINTLSNMTYEFSYYVFDVRVAYKEDVDRVVEVLKGVGEEIMQDQEYSQYILEPIEVLGVDQFADSAVIIKARIKTFPIQQWLVGREMNRRIKNRFDELGIEIPFPQRTLYFGGKDAALDGKPFDLMGNREKLKQLIREVLQESGSRAPAANQSRN